MCLGYNFFFRPFLKVLLVRLLKTFVPLFYVFSILRRRRIDIIFSVIFAKQIKFYWWLSLQCVIICSGVLSIISQFFFFYLQCGITIWNFVYKALTRKAKINFYEKRGQLYFGPNCIYVRSVLYYCRRIIVWYSITECAK